MTKVRNEIYALKALGPLPSEDGADPDVIERYEALYRAIARPISDDEARILVSLFGNDDCFGLASSLMHLVETSPGWPLQDCLQDTRNEWVAELRDRAIRGGRLSP